MLGLWLLLLTGLGLLWCSGVIVSVWMLTHPPRRTYSAAVARGRPGDSGELAEGPRRFERWCFKSRGLELPVWDVPGDDPAGPTIIVTHGWADSRIGSLARLPALLPVCSRILAWELPGHGEAPGQCRLGTRESDDLLALIERARPERLILFGWSLGAGICLEAARRWPGNIELLGIIAEAPYRLAPTPASNVLLARGFPARLLVPPAFAVLRGLLGPGLSDRTFDRAAAPTGVPVMVLHGSDDVVCPVEDGRAIAAAWKAVMCEIRGGGHNDLWTEPELAGVSTAGVREFIRSLARRPGA